MKVVRQARLELSGGSTPDLLRPPCGDLRKKIAFLSLLAKDTDPLVPAKCPQAKRTCVRVLVVACVVVRPGGGGGGGGGGLRSMAHQHDCGSHSVAVGDCAFAWVVHSGPESRLRRGFWLHPAPSGRDLLRPPARHGRARDGAAPGALCPAGHWQSGDGGVWGHRPAPGPLP